MPVAAIVTEYRVNSHADVIVGKILEGFDQQGGPGPDLQLVSLYTDQVPKTDLSRGLARKHGFLIADTIEQAITLGTGKVAVAGVLSIGEHGNYPFVPGTGQHMYPRRRFFDAIAAAFEKHGQVVPVFNDKHLAYRWEDARHMFDTARRLHIPLLAGSSVPLAWRIPELELSRDCQIDAALMIGYGGLESYGFHTLEAMQCQLERRRGGETGVRSVQAVTGDEIAKARAAGRWSEALLQAAAAVAPTPGRGPRPKSLDKKAEFWLIEYTDGLRVAVAMNTGLAHEFSFAAQLKSQEKPAATWFELQDGKPYLHFAELVRAIEHTVHTGKPAYPAERTLLTTGILDAAMHSMADGHKPIRTDHLAAIAYKAADWPHAQGRAPKPRESP